MLVGYPVPNARNLDKRLSVIAEINPKMFSKRIQPLCHAFQLLHLATNLLLLELVNDR